MNRKKAIEIIRSGKFFSVVFTKKDGEIRKLNGRSGVKKHLRPNAKSQSWEPTDLGYLPVFDVQKNGYRLIDSRTIISINNTKVK